MRSTLCTWTVSGISSTVSKKQGLVSAVVQQFRFLEGSALIDFWHLSKTHFRSRKAPPIASFPLCLSLSRLMQRLLNGSLSLRSTVCVLILPPLQYFKAKCNQCKQRLLSYIINLIKCSFLLLLLLGCRFILNIYVSITNIYFS